MVDVEEINHLCRELPPSEIKRAIKFNEVAMDEAEVSYEMFIEQGKLPRQVFLRGYDAMFAAAALFLAKKYNVKLDETVGRTHKNMRTVLDYYTRDSEHHHKLLNLYETAIERFQDLSQQYHSKSHFAKKVVGDLISEGFHQGKKANYYSEKNPVRKDPLELTILDAKKFIENIVKPFLYIIENLTK